jgi:hypothetical protein
MRLLRAAQIQRPNSRIRSGSKRVALRRANVRAPPKQLAPSRAKRSSVIGIGTSAQAVLRYLRVSVARPARGDLDGSDDD